MDVKTIEAKWQQRWEETGLYKFHPERADKKLYCLEMFSYPSGYNLHIGHWYNYGPSDSWARFKRMQGYEVFQPMGFDAFGLPAENFAIKTGVHPKDSTMRNVATMEAQLKRMGASFDWDYEVITSEPEYYKWTQWLFLQLYKNGLAYRKEAPVNWCPSCNTVLANEQVLDGACERCQSVVTKRNLTQWFFKITQYADELLEKLDDLDWPERTKAMQRNWIGRSTGGELTFRIEGGEAFQVFTTRADTLCGATYCVIAPEAPIVDRIVTDDQRAAVEAYREEAKRVTEIDRLSTTREKTGVFTGAYAINPINGRRIPVWVADYVLATYGTGCVMAVPAHDERDFAFATKYGLPIERVIQGAPGEDDLPFTGDGVLVNSDAFTGLSVEDGKKAIIEALAAKDLGRFQVNYRLRDWLISRQRYWGAPIPMIYCDKCGIVPVPEDQLPVELPYDVDFKPDGTSPLASHPSFQHCTCPQCGGDAHRDYDTMDTFVCSSWYFLRYPCSHDADHAFDTAVVDRMLPVDKYVGGPEHACMHLLYARFFTKALRDMGLLHFDEPFQSLTHQGIILAPDGNRMSKSRGNIVSPDGYVEQYGSDAFRMYLMFGFAYIEGGPWNDDGIKAIDRFLSRIERIVQRAIELRGGFVQASQEAEAELAYALHRTIKLVTQDTQIFQFNTSIARLMELVNALYKADGQVGVKTLEETVKTLVKLLAPFAPHMAEEWWERMGQGYSVFEQAWPVHDESKLTMRTVEMAVQVNGKVRGKIVVASDADEEAIRAAAMGAERIAEAIAGKSVKKVLVVKGRLVNIVVG